MKRGAFTLIELILVMALLAIVLGFVGPTLGRFFRGRTLDSEARRLLSLTRYGQSRAISDGVPMILWIDPDQRRYGLEAEYTFTDGDEKAIEYELGKDLEIEVESSTLTGGVIPRQQTMAASRGRAFGRNTVQIRFLPDGLIGETSPYGFELREKQTVSKRPSDDETGIWISQNRNRLSYEIKRTKPPLPAADRALSRAGFTLVEALAAMAFLAILIPVVMRGLQVANLAGQVADRKASASRVADRLLNELVVTGQWKQSSSRGTVEEGTQQFRWQLRSRAWDKDALRLVSVEVTYAVQGRDYDVTLSTLVDGSQQ
jgi:prepilin-type N-terminal cleavage/methylation domain-containing protein